MSTPIAAADTGTGAEIARAAQLVTTSDSASVTESTDLRPGAVDSGAAADSATASYVAATTWTVSPAAGDTVHTTTPVFTLGVKRVSVDADTVLPVSLEVSSTADFSSGVQEMTFSTPFVDGQAATTVTTTTALTSGVYYWRVSSDTGAVWTTAVSFTVASGTASSVAVTGHWTLGVFDPTPAVWYARPPRARIGDEVTIVGAGLGTGGGSSAVSVGAVGATPVSWTVVAATGDAYTSARVIDPLANIVSPEHSEVVITTPTLAPPGGPLLVLVDAAPAPPPFGTPLLWWVGDDVTGGSTSWPSRGSITAFLHTTGAPILPGAVLNTHQGLDVTAVSLAASFLGTIDLSAGIHLFAVLRPVGGMGSGDNLLFHVQSSDFTIQAFVMLATDGSNLSTLTLDVENTATFDDLESYSIPSSVQDVAFVLEWQYLPTTLRLAGSGVSTTPDPGNTGTPAGIVCGNARTAVSTAPLVLYELLVFDAPSAPDITAIRSYLTARYGLTA